MFNMCVLLQLLRFREKYQRCYYRYIKVKKTFIIKERLIKNLLIQLRNNYNFVSY